MYAVIGTWAVDGALTPEQLTHIADTVRQQPGFVRGYWGQETHNVDTAHAVALFEDEAHAQEMADGVKSAIHSAQLCVVEVMAEA